MLHLQHKTKHLVLSSAALGELERNTSASQLSVDLRISIKSVINTALLLLIENDLQQLSTIFLGSETLADDLNGVDEVGENGIMDGGQCSGTGALLCLAGAGTVGSFGAGENTAGSENENVTVGELLLELTGETGVLILDVDSRLGELRGEDIPLLHFVETLKGWDGDKDDNSLLAVANFNLYMIKVSMRAPRKVHGPQPVRFHSADTSYITYISHTSYMRCHCRSKF
jgi:hypothetical protein